MDGYVDVVEDALSFRPLPHLPRQLYPIQPHAAGGRVLLKSSRLADCTVYQLEGADLHHVSLLEEVRTCQVLAVDKGAIGAVLVGDDVPVGRAVEVGVAPGDDRSRYGDVGLGIAPDEQRGLCPQSRGPYVDGASDRSWRSHRPGCPEGEADRVALRVADAQDVAVAQHGAPRALAVDKGAVGAAQVYIMPRHPSLLQPAVVARDVAGRQNDVIVRLATDGKGRLIQGQLPQRPSSHADGQAWLLL